MNLKRRAVQYTSIFLLGLGSGVSFWCAWGGVVLVCLGAFILLMELLRIVKEMENQHNKQLFQDGESVTFWDL